MTSEVFNLAILLSLKDGASGGLDSFSAKIRSAQKDGKQFAQTFEGLREEMNKGLAIGGVGLASLALLGKGVQVAGNFQSTMTDLRTSLSIVQKDGSINLNQLGKDMQKAETIAIRLGNSLPGTTENFAEMMQILKVNGLATETIMNGAADAVGNLAVANNALPKDVAKDFAQFGQLFKLRPDEYVKAADTVSRLYTSAGIGTGELVEGLKYFQGRAGAALGIIGLKDANSVVRVLGLLRKQGLEGSVAGTSLNNLFMGYLAARNKKDDPIERLKQLEKIDIKLFDDKGNFAGIDNLFKQLEPLQKLTEEKRLTYLKEIFGEEGMSAATAMLKTGADGWRVYNEEQNKTISLQQKNAEKAKDFNNQLEALTGTAKNLVVTAFEPMLPSITNGISSLNSMVGSLQQFGKTNPALLDVLGTIALYGSTAMTVVGGFKAMTNTWKLFQIATTFSRSNNLLEFLNGAAQTANTASTRVAGFAGNLEKADTKAKGLKGTWQNLMKSPAANLGVQFGTVVAAEIALKAIFDLVSKIEERSQKLIENAKAAGKSYDEMMGAGLLFNKPGDFGKDNQFLSIFDSKATDLLQKMNEGRVLEFALNPDRKNFWETFTTPATFGWTKEQTTSNYNGKALFNPEVAVKEFKKQNLGQALHDPNVLSRLLLQIDKGDQREGGMNLDLEGVKLLRQTLEKMVEPPTWENANKLVDKEKGVTQNFLPNPKVIKDLFNPLGGFNQLFPQKNNPILNPLPQTPTNNPFGLVTSASTNFFNGLDKPITSITTALGNVSQPANDTSKGLFNLNSSAVELPPQFLTLGKSTDGTKQSVFDFGQALNQTQTPLSTFISASNNAAGGLNSLADKLFSWTPPTPQGQPSGAFGDIVAINPPSKASGGRVKSKGLAYIHAGEDIVPANVTSRYEESQTEKSSAPITINYSPQITVYGGDKDAEQKFRTMLYQHKKDLERIVAERLNNGRIRA